MLKDMTDVESEKRSFLNKTFLKKAIPITLLIIIIISVIVFFYGFNGNSLDFSNSEILIGPTDSMDGEPQEYPIKTISRGCVPLFSRFLTRFCLCRESLKRNLRS